jgi:transcriptional regulator NrdR family protein
MDFPNCGAPYMISMTRKDIRIRGVPAERKRRRCPECGYHCTTFEITETLLDEMQKEAHSGALETERDKFLAYLARVKAGA